MTTPLRFLGWGVSNWQAAFEWLGTGLKRRQGVDFEIVGKRPQTSPRMEVLSVGVVDVAITTPTADAEMAYSGIGPHPQPLSNLRAIGVLPHRDRLVVAVTAAAARQYGLDSLSDLGRAHPPLRLATPERDNDSPNFTIEQLLASQNLVWNDLISWGGRWFEMPNPMPAPDLITSGQADGVFNEAFVLLHTLGPEHPLHFLAFDDDVLTSFETRFGLHRAYIEPDEFPGVRRRVPVLDFSNWVIMVRDNLEDAVAYGLAETLIEDRIQFESRYHASPAAKSALFYPIEPASVPATGKVPLHPGAERYYREIGVL